MHIALVLLLVVHGLIHMLGFVKAFGLGPVPSLSGATLWKLPVAFGKPIGALWLVACLGLLGAALLLLARQPAWWMVAAAAVVLSQLLVIYAWPDAKWGTVANVMLMLAITVAWGDWRFQRQTDEVVRAMLAPPSKANVAVVTADELAALPPPVRRWLRRSGVVGKARPTTVRLEQRGQLRGSLEQSFMPALAQQYFRVDEPAFVWRVRVRMLKVVPMAGRDSYLDGHGRMWIKALSLVSVVDAADAKIDQGALLRYLGEIVWFPSAALSRWITWEAIDAETARATLQHANLKVTAVFRFDAQGRFQRLDAERYLGAGDKAELLPWVVTATAWKTLSGIEVPVRGDVRWKLPSGEFSYYRWEVTALEYDRPELFESR